MLELVAAPEDLGFAKDRLDKMVGHFNRYVETDRLPGWLVTVARRGQLCWTGWGGLADKETNRPVGPDTIWRIYSMTKPLTSVAAMLLCEEGKFDLNDPAGKWIDSLRAPRVYVGGPPTAPITVPATEPVRVHHLLSHLSGLTYGFQYTHPVDAIYRAKGYEFGSPKDKGLAEVVDDWCSAPLLFQPGSRWNYSVSVDVLGRLIELWSGQPLDVFFRERLLEPLGMTETTWSCPADKVDRLANLYGPTKNGLTPLPAIAGVALHEPRYFSGGGGLLSTARDYHRFTSFLLGRGEFEGTRLLSPRTLALMTRNHLPNGGDLAEWADDSFSEVHMAGVGFGLGFSVVVDPAKNKSPISTGSFAWGGAASTVFWVDPKEEVTAAFYTQLLPSSTYNVRRELQQFVYSALVD